MQSTRLILGVALLLGWGSDGDGDGDGAGASGAGAGPAGDGGLGATGGASAVGVPRGLLQPGHV